MKFTSFHSRVYVVLVTTGIFLFLMLSLLMSYFLRSTVNSVMINLQKPRVEKIFSALDKRFDGKTAPQTIQRYLDSLFLEINLGLYDKHNMLILQKINKNFPDSFKTVLHAENPITGFAHVYYNTNDNSPFHAIMISIAIANKPVFRLMVILTFLFALLVFGVFYWVSARLGMNLRQRLSHLKSGVEELASGRLDIKLLEDDYQDEITFLARSFNQMSERLREVISSLEESNAARQRMFAHASHEIKSPLTSIKGFVDIVDFTGVLPPMQRPLLNEVKRDLERIIKISNDILQLSAMRETTFRLERSCINCAELIREEHSHFKRRAQGKNVRAELHLEDESSGKSFMDADRLGQILNNLWYNALKYGNGHDGIDTWVVIKKGNMHVDISNTLTAPIDVPAERLFEPFYRHPAMADKANGSGLGLVIVRELCTVLDGTVSAHIQKKRLTVTLDIPLPACPDDNR